MYSTCDHLQEKGPFRVKSIFELSVLVLSAHYEIHNLVLAFSLP